MDRLESLETGAKLAVRSGDEETLKQIARDRMLVKRSLVKIVNRIENQRDLAEGLEKALMTTERKGNEISTSSRRLPYETEEDIERKFRSLEREAMRRNVDWIKNFNES